MLMVEERCYVISDSLDVEDCWAKLSDDVTMPYRAISHLLNSVYSGSG